MSPIKAGLSQTQRQPRKELQRPKVKAGPPSSVWHGGWPRDCKTRLRWVGLNSDFTTFWPFDLS